jgi:hypothetical protein
MTKVRVLVGLVSDQTKQEAKKVEAKGICQVTNLFSARWLLLGPNFAEFSFYEVG